MQKIGQFDWIASYDQLAVYFSETFLPLSQDERREAKVLVVGCGKIDSIFTFLGVLFAILLDTRYIHALFRAGRA